MGFEKHGVFLGTYDDAFCWWVKGQLVFSPTVVLARDVDIVLIADEQMHFSVVGSTAALMAELDKALGDEGAIHAALGDFIDQLGIGFGEEDRAWAKKFLRREIGSP